MHTTEDYRPSNDGEDVDSARLLLPEPKVVMSGWPTAVSLVAKVLGVSLLLSVSFAILQSLICRLPHPPCLQHGGGMDLRRYCTTHTCTTMTVCEPTDKSVKRRLLNR